VHLLTLCNIIQNGRAWYSLNATTIFITPSLWNKIIAGYLCELPEGRSFRYCFYDALFWTLFLPVRNRFYSPISDVDSVCEAILIIRFPSFIIQHTRMSTKSSYNVFKYDCNIEIFIWIVESNYSYNEVNWEKIIWLLIGRSGEIAQDPPCCRMSNLVHFNIGIRYSNEVLNTYFPMKTTRITELWISFFEDVNWDKLCKLIWGNLCFQELPCV